MNRTYNHNAYKVTQKFNGVARDKLSPSVGESFNVFGVIGKILGKILDYIIVKPIHFLAFAITSLFYNKNKEKPYKGSFIYTVCFILLMIMTAGIVKKII